jgi:hypothetical protein
MFSNRSRICLPTSSLVAAFSVSLTLAITGPALASPQPTYEQCLRDGFSHEACWDKQTRPNRVRVA